jgi:hypothetical protein
VKLPSITVRQKETKLEIPESNLATPQKKKSGNKNKTHATPIIIIDEPRHQPPPYCREDVIRTVLMAVGIFVAGYCVVKGYKYLSNFTQELVEQPIADGASNYFAST